MRAQNETERRILAMAEPEAKGLGLDIVRVRLSGARTPVLQIMAERPDGTVSVEDCARLSRRLSPILDMEDPISGEYALEVSSPGIDRPLTRPGDFAKWTGHEVRVEIGYPVDGRKRFHGFIAGEANGVATLTLKDGGTSDIALTEMIKAHLVLTDRLIAEAQARGQVPAEVDEEEIDGDFDDVEIVEDAEGFDEIESEDEDSDPAEDAGNADERE